MQFCVLVLIVDFNRGEDLIADKPIMSLPGILKIQFMPSLVVSMRRMRSGSPALRSSLPPAHPNPVEGLIDSRNKSR